MEKFPKFIIEDGKLILAKVTFHKELVTDQTKVKGGGWFRFINETNTFVLFGESNDFGKAKLEDIKQCVENNQVYNDKNLRRNISSRFNFSYDEVLTNNKFNTINLKQEA